jgi:hypothetical protein
MYSIGVIGYQEYVFPNQTGETKNNHGRDPNNFMSIQSIAEEGSNGIFDTSSQNRQV